VPKDAGSYSRKTTSSWSWKLDRLARSTRAKIKWEKMFSGCCTATQGALHLAVSQFCLNAVGISIMWSGIAGRSNDHAAWDRNLVLGSRSRTSASRFGFSVERDSRPAWSEIGGDLERPSTAFVGAIVRRAIKELRAIICQEDTQMNPRCHVVRN
jgi:hypothetical protein